MWKTGMTLAITICPLLSSVIVPPAQADVRRLAAIPASFSGSWASTADGCKSRNDSLTISAKGYVGQQANCNVISVSETAGVQGSIYSSRLQCRNAQTKRARSTTVILRQDLPDRISVGPDFSSLKTYDRCSAAIPTSR